MPQGTPTFFPRGPLAQHAVLLSFLTIVLTPTLASAGSPLQPKSSKWELIARSDVVAKARLEVPVRALRDSLDKKRHAYIQLQLHIEESVKGNRHRSVQVHYYTEPASRGPSASTLLEHNGKEVIVFLVQPDYRDSAGNTYFAGYTADALCRFTPEEFGNIRREVAQQREIVRQFVSEEFFGDKMTPSEQRIKMLFDGLTSEETQAASWEQLLKATLQDVPTIVKLMDDERYLAKRGASVPSTSPYEAMAHYGPARISEAASLLLTYLTETRSFRFVFNGGSPRERRANLDGWRVWYRYGFE